MATIKIKPEAGKALALERAAVSTGAERLGESQVRLLLSRYHGHDEAAFLRGILSEAKAQLDAMQGKGVIPEEYS